MRKELPVATTEPGLGIIASCVRSLAVGVSQELIRQKSRQKAAKGLRIEKVDFIVWGFVRK
jgi:hypothetical protein